MNTVKIPGGSVKLSKERVLLLSVLGVLIWQEKLL